MEFEIKDIIGKQVLSLSMDASKKCLAIETNGGEFLFFAVGGCCSSSWFEHINGSQDIIGGVILKIEGIENHDLDGIECENKTLGDDYSVTRKYISRVITESAVLEIEFRNESNGYYEGWLTCGVDQYDDKIDRPTLNKIMADF